MSNQIIAEQLVIGEDSLDSLNAKVNNYIAEGYQPKDPMLEIRNLDGNQYHYTQTMVKYIADPNPGDLGSLVVKYIKASGIDAMIDQISDDDWKKIFDNIVEAIRELIEEQAVPF